MKRPKVESYEGKTPALGDHQARALLNAPDTETVKGKRDRAMLSTLLYHGLRREELCTLKVRDITQRRGVLHLRVHGKGSKLRYLPLHPGTAEVITDYVEAVGHGNDPSAPLFRPVRNNVHQRTDEPMTTDGVYKVVQYYARKIGIGDIERIGVHALRATAATTNSPPRAPAEGKALSIHTPPSGALRREDDTPPSCIRLMLLMILLYINIWTRTSRQLKTWRA